MAAGRADMAQAGGKAQKIGAALEQVPSLVEEQLRQRQWRAGRGGPTEMTMRTAYFDCLVLAAI
jgi:hypothetical protein